MNDFHIGVTKEARERDRFRNPPTKFLPETALRPKERKVLELLEYRAIPNNGDTKVYNGNLEKLTGYAKRTVERILKKLEDKLFISRIVTRGYDVKRKNAHKNPFYTLRVIRCNRVALNSHFRFYSKDELGWKTDNRPVTKQEQLNLDYSWFIDQPHGFRKGLHWVEIQPKWISSVDLEPLNACILTRLEKSNELVARAQYGFQDAIAIVGIPRQR